MSSIQRKPRILIVDDEETFRLGLKHVLMGAGYDVMLTVSGHMALQLMERFDYDLILSDIHMPDGDGIELLNAVKVKYPTPVILMTGMKSIIETKKAFDSGARKFISKPFSGEELLSVIKECISGEPNPIEEVQKKYCSLPIDDFICGKEMRYDIFIRLSPTNFFKIAKGGANLRSEQIQIYRSKGIDRLWLLKSDFRDYLKFNVRIGQSLVASKIDPERKLQFLQQTSKLLLGTTGTEYLDKDFLDQGIGIVESVVSILTENDEALALFDFLNANRNDPLYAHSLGVALYSTLMALKLGWTHPATLFHIGAGGLFHDIGMKEIPAEILAKSRMAQTPAERAFYETHPMRGAELLRAIPETPDEVIWIVQQHHENELGCGYPARMKKNRIYPPAKLMSVADEFCEAILKEPKIDKACVAKVLYQMAKLSGGIHDPGMVCTLMSVFDIEIPVDLRHAYTSTQIKKVAS